MRTLFLTLVCAAVGLGSLGCDTKPKSEKAAAKDQGGATTPEAKQGQPAAQPPEKPAAPANAEPPPAAAAADEVRPPTAEDLAAFTKDLPGNGPLKATIETSMGTFNCELFGDKAPMTVANFVGLARGLLAWRHPQTGEVSKKPYFDGLIFHRVIPGFMIQGGDPMGMGVGGPGYTFDNEIVPELRHDKGGILSMANTGRPRSNGSQFFITEVPTRFLDGKHTVFGQCKEVDLVKKITAVPRGPNDKPTTDVVMKRVVISRGK